MVILVRGTDTSRNHADWILCAMAATAIQKYSKRVLLLQTSKDTALEQTLIGMKLAGDTLRNEIFTFNDDGMEALMRRIEMGTLTNEQFSDCCHHLSNTMNTFDVAGVPHSEDFPERLQSDIKAFKELLRNANNVYDVVFVYTDILSEEFLSAISEVVTKEIVCISQGPKENYISKAEDKYFAIDSFDASSSFTTKHLAKTYGTKKIFPIPYNIEFKDVCLKKYAMQMWYTNQKPEEADENFMFMSSVSNFVGAVLEVNEPVVKEREFVFKKKSRRTR